MRSAGTVRRSSSRDETERSDMNGLRDGNGAIVAMSYQPTRTAIIEVKLKHLSGAAL